MGSAELEELLARYFDGDLDDAAAARLGALLDADPKTLDRFHGLAAIEGLLRAREADRDALVTRVTASVRDERRRRLTLRVMETLHHRARRNRPSHAIWIAAAAAAFLALVGLAVAVRPPDRPRPTVRYEKPPEIPAEPPPAPEAVRAPSREEVPPPPPPPLERSVPPVLPAQPPPPVPPPSPPAVPPREPEAPRTETKAVGLLLERAEGAILDIPGSGKAPARAWQPLDPGVGLETSPGGNAEVAFADGTRLRLAGSTTIRGISEREKKGRGKRVQILSGSLEAEVVRQPADEPLVVATPHGEVRVLGTSLRVVVAPEPKGQTAVEVREGRVRVIRSKDGRSLELGAGRFTVVGPGVELASRPVHLDEIVLAAPHGRLTGDEWKLVADKRASAGAALEAVGTPYKVADHVRRRPASVTFTFFATAGKDYHVWVRAASQATGDPWTRDLLTVDPVHAGANQKCPFFGTSDQSCFVFGGIASSATYHWVSGLPQEGREATPLVVRFKETGPQTLKLYVAHPSIRVDCVWLSSSQSARPAPKQFPP